MSNPASLTFGVIGAGDIAALHAETLLSEPEVKIAAVAEPDGPRRDAFATRFKVQTATADWRELLQDQRLNAILILTPHHLHHPMVTAALKARKHVICEKPMARTVSECDGMLAEAASAGRGLYIAHNLRNVFFPRTVMARIAAGAIGRPTLGSFQWFTDEISRLDDPRHWKGTVDRSGGGVFIDGGCHVSDLGNLFFGPARRVAAMGRRMVAALPDRGEDNGAFLVEYASGATCTFALSFTNGKAYRGERFGAGMFADIWGTDGHLEGGYLVQDADMQHFCHEHRAGQGEVRHPVPEGVERGIDKEFVRSILTGAPPPISAVDARNAVAVVEAAYRSTRSGRIEDVDWRS